VDTDVAPPIGQPLGSVTTERMHLRPFAHSDLNGLAAVFTKPEVWRFPYGRGLTKDETKRFLDSQIQDWDRFGFGCWVAEPAERNRIIGYVGLSVPQFLPEILPAVEVGWRFDPEYWGQGLASEGARAALAEGFTTVGFQEICSLPQSLNPQSSKVCERIGMHFDRSVLCPATDRRGAVEARMYVLTAVEWAAHRAQGGSDNP
jgi:RimJ/RimL family protein N-acetyltransferase